MSSAPFLNRPPTPVVLDRSVVTAALFLSVFTPRMWRRLGPVRLAEYVTQIAADPRCRLTEMASLLGTGAGVLPPAELHRLEMARRYAGRVLAVLSN